MMQSISHWGQFEMQAAGTENFREHLSGKTVKGFPVKMVTIKRIDGKPIRFASVKVDPANKPAKRKQ